ncbi:MAG: UPF0175 family protein [Bacteroidota bacterium]|jgi:predicted HTH domain antitoxin
MKTITVHLPDTLDMDEQEINMLLAVKLYEQGKLSLGQAAELVGMRKRAFAEILGQYQVSVFNYPASDLLKDLMHD